MLQALIVTLREGVEAALIIGITLAYLAKIGRSDLRKTVYWGLATAFIGSVAGGVIIRRLEVNEDKLEGWIMLVAAVFVISMVIFMMSAGRKMKGEIESKLSSLTSGSKWGLFLFVFLMIFREGVETVLALSGISLNSSELMSLIGTFLGIALAVIFGVMFVKGTVRINLQKFFRVTSVILIFVAVELVVSGIHELFESGVFQSNKQEMAIVGPIVRNVFFFPVTILALAGLMVLLEYRRRQPEVMAVAASKAEERKLQWTARRERMWSMMLCTTAFIFIVLITAGFINEQSATKLSDAKEVAFVNGQITIPRTEVADGDLHRYSATVNGQKLRFLLYRKPNGDVATVYDACQICGAVGFYKTATGITCKNCAAPINPQSVGEPGGCNPVPLKSKVVGDSIVITTADLAEHAEVFQK